MQFGKPQKHAILLHRSDDSTNMVPITIQDDTYIYNIYSLCIRYKTHMQVYIYPFCFYNIIYMYIFIESISQRCYIYIQTLQYIYIYITYTYYIYIYIYICYRKFSMLRLCYTCIHTELKLKRKLVCVDKVPLLMHTQAFVFRLSRYV